MISRIAILLIGTIMSLSTFAQGKVNDTLIRYFNANLEPVKKKEAVFVAVVVKDQQGWNALVYDDSMRILLRGKYTDANCKVKDGWFMYYYANENRASGGRFAQNIRVDNWKSWYPNGQLKDSFIYVNNEVEGPAKSFHESGVLASEGVYKMGKYDGPWTFYHENARPSTKEIYKEGRLVSLECFDSTGTSTGFNCGISMPPAPVGKYGSLEKYFKDSMHIPLSQTREPIEGYVNVEFTIMRDGKLTNYRVISSDDAALTKEVARLIFGIQDWHPAVSHNRNVDFTVTLSVPFFVNQGDR